MPGLKWRETCRQGHPRTPENTIRSGHNVGRCRLCRNGRQQKARGYEPTTPVAPREISRWTEHEDAVAYALNDATSDDVRQLIRDVVAAR